jgi:hypothetical protein
MDSRHVSPSAMHRFSSGEIGFFLLIDEKREEILLRNRSKTVK